MSPTMLLISQDMNPPPVFRDLLCCMGLPRIYKVFFSFFRIRGSSYICWVGLPPIRTRDVVKHRRFHTISRADGPHVWDVVI